MTLFYILVLIMLTGAGAIAWILIAEKKKESPSEKPLKTSEPQLSPKDLLDRLGLEKPLSTTPAAGQPTAILASAKAESELSLKYDELLMEHNELTAKYAKIETLFAEKSLALEKSEKTLTNELKNQKEFNKVKDILEKEIKDSKDKINSLQADVSGAETETQTQLKRVQQLEEKVKKLEMEVLTSEAAINDAQALTQLARKHSSELEEKLRTLENQILEKNQKIEDLVSRLKDLPNIFPSNTLKNSDLAQPPDSLNVDEKGGQQEEDLPSPVSVEPQREEPAVDENSTLLKNIPAPEILPHLEKQSSQNTVIEKPADGALTLRPDILANQQNTPESKEKTDT